MYLLTTAFERPHWRAAAVKLPASTTRMKASIWSRRSIVYDL